MLHKKLFPCMALLVASLATPSGVFAQNVSKPDIAKAIPANAQPKPYGSGWECKPGFRQGGTACAVIKQPENAYPDG